MKKIAFAILFLTFAMATGQDEKYGKIDKDDLELKVYMKDTSAGAVYLYKGRESWLTYDDNWVVKTRIHERIKILNKSGLDYATKKILLYKGDESNQEITKLKGASYTLVDGKQVKVELDERNEVYKTIPHEDWEEVSFAIPNAQVGSVIEWEYTTEKPGLYAIDDLILQEDIPVRKYHAEIRNPYFIKFNILKKGYFDMKMGQDLKKETMGVNWKQEIGYMSSRKNGVMSYNELISTFDKEDIPRLREEPYVGNVDNYRYTVVYELESYEMDEDNPHKYSTTWEDVATRIFKYPDFGGQLENLRFLSQEAARLKHTYNTDEERMKGVFEYVRDNYSWNGEYGKYVDKNLREVFKDKTGNVAELNFLLIGLLREIGLSAHPILVSTRQNGIPVFPTIKGYNYVIAGVLLDDELYIMDATEKMSSVNVLPERDYNWKGRLIRQTGVSMEVDLYPKIPSRENTMVMAEISDDGSVTGKMQRRLTSVMALNYRKTVDDDPGKRETTLANNYNLDEVFDVKQEDMKLYDLPVIEGFSFEKTLGVEQVGDNLYVDPLLFLKMASSPFNYEDRTYPVDFVYPFETIKNISIILPGGYEVVSLPEAANIAMPDDLGSFYYNISHKNGKLSLLVKFSVNKSIVPVNEYGSLREFYKLRVAKENEKVVLKRT